MAAHHGRGVGIRATARVAHVYPVSRRGVSSGVLKTLAPSLTGIELSPLNPSYH